MQSVQAGHDGDVMFRYDRAMSPGRAHRIVVIAQDGAYPFELGIPARVFGAAGDTYQVMVCTPTGEPISTNAGFSIVPTHGPEVLTSADTVIVAPVEPYSLRRELTPAMRDAVASIRPSARIASICTGGFVLAAAGLLDTRRATTHWECSALFRSWYPQVTLDENVLFTHDGRIYTSAGAASGLDLCLELIRQDHGPELANTAARRCVTAPHRDGGQAQFIERPVPEHPDASTSRTRDWALQHLSEMLTVAGLAKHAHMSDRTFVRRFTEETGMAPRRWLTHQRLASAKDLLEDTDLSIEEISAIVGYATATSLRNHLSAQLGVSPAAYRRTYRPSRVAGRRP
jgi:transcriptional regulator GlxA family with amidase domain